MLDEEIEKYDTEDFEQELVGNYELLSEEELERILKEDL